MRRASSTTQTPEPTTDADADTIDGAYVGGLDPNPLLPGPDGTMNSEWCTLTIVGGSATLTLELAFTAGVEYEDESVVCLDDFTFTTVGSDLTVDGTTVSGTTDLVLEFVGGTNCPDAEQDDIGVPIPVGVSGEVGASGFTGELSFDGFGVPFSAALEGG
jgi:hypothetical protein